MSEQKQKAYAMKRYANIDYIKVICIFLMVVCHYGLTKENTMLKCMIYAFHMPLLYYISGYLYKPHSLLYNLRGLGVAILIYTILTFFVKYPVIYSKTSESIDIYLYKLYIGALFPNDGIHYPFTGYWFVISLLLTKILISWMKIEKLFFLSVVCVIITELNGYTLFSKMLKECYIFRPIQILPLIYIGNYLKLYENSKWMKSIPIGILLVVLSLPLAYVNGEVEMAVGVYGKSYIIFIVQSVCMFIGLLILLQQIKNINFIQALSIGTFFILGTHMLFLHRISSALSCYIGYYAGSIFTAIVYFVVCVPIISICNKKYPALLGKVKK